MSLDRDGFQLVPSCFTDTDCDEFCHQLVHVQSAGTRNLLLQDWCRTLSDDVLRRLADFIPGLRSLNAIQCTYFNKSSSVNWLVPFHQDRSVPVTDVDGNLDGVELSVKEGLPYIQADEQLLKTLIACRIHLDPSTNENGPLRVIRGSHKLGILSDQEIDAARRRAPEVTLTAPRGSALLMSPLLIHASAKSTSDMPRRVLQFLFAPPGVSFLPMSRRQSRQAV